MGSTSKEEYTLHQYTFSICSIMVRMTLAWRPSNHATYPYSFTENFIDIYNWRQLDEEYLQINPKGQVPALISPALPAPLTDSLDITYLLCGLYPSLAPDEFKDQIKQILRELHQIQYLSVSFSPSQNRAPSITAAIEERLARPNISSSYKHALEYKLK